MRYLAHGAGVAFLLVGLFSLLVQVEKRPTHDSAVVVVSAVLVGLGVGLCTV